jgi:hypothetical protein
MKIYNMHNLQNVLVGTAAKIDLDKGRKSLLCNRERERELLS